MFSWFIFLIHHHISLTCYIILFLILGSTFLALGLHYSAFTRVCHDRTNPKSQWDLDWKGTPIWEMPFSWQKKMSMRRLLKLNDRGDFGSHFLAKQVAWPNLMLQRMKHRPLTGPTSKWHSDVVCPRLHIVLRTDSITWGELKSSCLIMCAKEWRRRGWLWGWGGAVSHPDQRVCVIGILWEEVSNIVG